MKIAKTFDCVEMKNSIQAKLAKEHEGLSSEEIRRRRREWLETSNDEMALFWRRIGSNKAPERFQ